MIRSIFLSQEEFDSYLKHGIRAETMEPIYFTWTTPLTSFVKLNVDGSFHPNSSFMGSGVLSEIRMEGGLLLL